MISAVPGDTRSMPTTSSTSPFGQRRTWVLTVPFDERALASRYGARWDKELRQTTWVGEAPPPELNGYLSEDHSWQRYIENQINPTPSPTRPPAEKFTARPHQEHAAEAITTAYAAGYRGFLLADEVGTGKTISAIEAVKLTAFAAGKLKRKPIKNVLVVTTLAAVPHWRRSITSTGAGDINWIVINYDRLKQLLAVPESAQAAKRARTKNKRTAKEGHSIVDWDIVIVDEAHKVKNPAAQRSQALANIADYAGKTASPPFIIWASATAGQNPVELAYLAPLLTQVTKSRYSEFKDFGEWLIKRGFHVEHEARFDRWVWVDSEAAREQDISRMHAILFKNEPAVAIRRLPTDIAGWPEILRELLPVELTLPERALYEIAWTAFRHEMHLAKKGNDPKAGMVARLRFRQKASLIRVNGTVEQAMDLLENGQQVAISVQFIETLDALAEAFAKRKVPVAVIDGTGRYQREDERLKFQTGRAPIVLFTVTEAISLHAGESLGTGQKASLAPRSTIIHDPRYSGIDSIQIEGRCHRDSQFAQVFYSYAEGTVEEAVVRTLLGRIQSTKALVGDDVSTVRALEGLLESYDESAIREAQANV